MDETESQLHEDPPMLRSRSIQDLGCLTQATLLNACLTEADLRGLRIWEDGPSRLGFSPAVWCRAHLHKACQGDPSSARRLSDLLDLRYLDTVVLVRCMGEDELERMANTWVEHPEGQALPGLLWALCTDPRDAVHALGARLCHEAVTVAFRCLVDETSRRS